MPDRLRLTPERLLYVEQLARFSSGEVSALRALDDLLHDRRVLAKWIYEKAGHHEDCDWYMTPSTPCPCGLDALRAELDNA